MCILAHQNSFQCQRCPERPLLGLEYEAENIGLLLRGKSKGKVLLLNRFLRNLVSRTFQTQVLLFKRKRNLNEPHFPMISECVQTDRRQTERQTDRQLMGLVTSRRLCPLSVIKKRYWYITISSCSNID